MSNIEKSSGKSSLAGAKKKQPVSGNAALNLKKMPKKQKPLHEMKEPSVAYVPMNSGNGHLVKSTQYGDSPMTTIEKMHLSRTGVTKEYLEKIKMQTKLDYTKLAKVLGVTRATLINKKKEEKFSPSLSERIVGLVTLYDYGMEVFEDAEIFNRWMFAPNKALGGELPYNLIDNQFGREEVRHILGRIEYGVYS